MTLAIQNYFWFRQAFPYSGPLSVLGESAPVLSLLCGYLFAFRLFRRLRPWWLTIFPLLALTSFCLWLLLSLFASLAFDVLLSPALQEMLNALVLTVEVCEVLSTPTFFVVMLRSIVRDRLAVSYRFANVDGRRNDGRPRVSS